MGAVRFHVTPSTDDTCRDGGTLSQTTERAVRVRIPKRGFRERPDRLGLAGRLGWAPAADRFRRQGKPFAVSGNIRGPLILVSGGAPAVFLTAVKG